jgi:P-type Cu+ transporter
MDLLTNNQALKAQISAQPSVAGAKIHCAHCLCLEEERKLFFNIKLNSWFCCQGCEAVYEFLRTEGLSSYYQSLAEAHSRSEIESKDLPKLNSKLDFYKAWTSDDFLQLYAKAQENSTELEMQFYVEGIRCVACTWLLDRLPKKFPQLLEVKSSFASQLLTIKFIKDQIDLRHLGMYVAKLGYKLHPLEAAGEAEKWRLLEDRKELLRLGLSAFFSSQIMIMATAIYAGADREWVRYFEWAIFLLSLPVFFYAAAPFYTNAFKQLKKAYIGLDSSMSVALLFGFSISFYHLLQDQRAQYFDSISMFVTLILGSRYLARKFNQHGLNIDFIPSNQSTELYYAGENLGWRKARELKVNDEFEVPQGQMIPVDSSLLSQKAFFSLSQINGEGRPQKIFQSMPVTSGAINLGDKIQLKVQRDFQSSYLGLYLKRLSQSWQDKTKTMNLSDKVAGYLIVCSLLLSAFTFTYYFSVLGFILSLERALAILIVTCPCALALGTPLAFTLALKKLLSRGIYVKRPQVLEKLTEVKNIFFDKTGTLSKGSFEIVKLPQLSSVDWGAVYSLELKSSHPLAQTLCRELKSGKLNQTLAVENFNEIPGQGVEGFVNANFYEIKKSQNSDPHLISLTQSNIYKNGQSLGELTFLDSIRPQSKKLVDRFKDKYEIFLLSGDAEQVVHEFAQEVGIKAKNTFGNRTPQEKAEILECFGSCLMVGDGLNDALSFSKADVAVSFGDSLALSQKSADVVVSSGRLSGLDFLLLVSKRIFRTTKTNILISLFYNLAGFFLAFNGLVDPFIAALLMPLSSMTIILHSYLQIQSLKERSL